MNTNSNEPPIYFMRNVGSLLGCQQICIMDTRCGYFGYDCNYYNCIIKAQSGTTLNDPAMISGRPIC